MRLDHRLPFRLASERVGLRRDIDTQLALGAVDCNADDPVAVVRRRTERDFGRRHSHARRLHPEYRVGLEPRTAQVEAVHRAALVFLDRRHAGLQLLQANEEERAAVARPIGEAEVGAADRLADEAQGLHIEHIQRGAFRALLRQPVGDVAAIGRRREVVDRVRLAGALLDRVGVDEQHFAPVETVPHVELELVVLRPALLIEPQITGRPGRADDARRCGRVVGLELCQQRVAAVDALQRRMREVAVRLHPPGDRRVLGVLEVAVRVADRAAEEGLVDVTHRRFRQALRPCEARACGQQRECGRAAQRTNQLSSRCHEASSLKVKNSQRRRRR